MVESSQESGRKDPSSERSDSADSYVPLADRLNQDVWHDNFVPKYSGLASVRPSGLILTGVWMIFGPALVMSVISLFGLMSEINHWMEFVLLGAVALTMTVIFAAILFMQTRRFLRYRRDRDR